jgi:hypothetical protein
MATADTGRTLRLILTSLIRLLRGITANVLDAMCQRAHINHMSDKRTTRDWRKYLTADEKAELAAVEREIEALKTKVTLKTVKRNRIQNRATVRAGK